METATAVLANVFVMFLAAKLAGEVCERLRQPPVVGELLAGMLLGPYALGWIGRPSPELIGAFGDAGIAAATLASIYDVLAQLGVIVLLFVVGLETRLSDLLRVGRRAVVVATGGILLSFGLLFSFAAATGQPTLSAVFFATALVATSIGITARVLADLGLLQLGEARIALGAAITDDILAMILLALVSALASGGELSFGTIGLLASEAVAFIVVVALAGRHLARRYSPHLAYLRISNAPFVVAVLLMLGLAVLSARLGLAAIIGAFLAGMIFAELRDEHELEQQTRPLYELLVPLFFVITGSHVDWRVFVNGPVLALGLVVVGLAIVGKLLGCGLGALGMGWRSALIVGMAMVPRGEVSLIVANVGQRLGLIPDALFSTIIMAVVLTTLVVPPLLALLNRTRSTEPLDDPLPDWSSANRSLPEP